MTVSRTAPGGGAKVGKVARKEAVDGVADHNPLQIGELSELLGYALKRAQLKVFEDFLRCMASLQLTPAQFSVLVLIEKNPGRN